MQNYDCVGVLGGGSWGTTLAHILAKNGHKVLLWLRDSKVMEDIRQNHRNTKYTFDFVLSERIKPTLDMEEMSKRCQVFVIAIPSHGFREVVYQLGNHTKGDQILISGCKGLEPNCCKTMTTILKEETCVKKIGVFSGPNLFQEILKGFPSSSVIASKYNEVIQKGSELFSSSTFKVYTSDDIQGVELGGVIKSVVAIAAGMTDGLGYGNNTKSLLVSRGIMEMGRIGVKLGAKPITFTGLAGIGDMICTCSSKLSRNYRVGFYLAQGKTLNQIMSELNSVVEGINIVKVLYEFCKEKGIKTPILEGVYQVLYQNKPIIDVCSELMNRFSHCEIDTILFS